MDPATKNAADREYVDRFFHGVASKLMTHPYFSKFANQTNIAAEVPASIARLDDVIAAYKNRLKPNTDDTNKRTMSLKAYADNMKLVNELFRKRKELQMNQKDVNCKDKYDDLKNDVQEIESRIQAVYGSAKVNKHLEKNEYDKCTEEDKTRAAQKAARAEIEAELRQKAAKASAEAAEAVREAERKGTAKEMRMIRRIGNLFVQKPNNFNNYPI